MATDLDPVVITVGRLETAVDVGGGIDECAGERQPFEQQSDFMQQVVRPARAGMNR